MPLESALHELTRNLEAMSLSVAELCVIAKDRPESMAVVDAFHDDLDVIQLCLTEAHEQIKRLSLPAGALEDNVELWQALLLCQERIDQITSLLYNLQSVDRVTPLLRFGLRQGGEWPIWAKLVTEGVTRCLLPLNQVRQAQLICWQEMAERSAGRGVNVRNTTVGQQIFWPEGQPPLYSRDR